MKQEQAWGYKNVELICGNGDRIASGFISVRDGEIVSLGEMMHYEKSLNLRDGEGLSIFPGFIDCHTHLTLSGLENPIAHLVNESISSIALAAAAHARETLFAGVTTVRDMGGGRLVDVAIRDAVNTGRIMGPRIYAAGLVICITGGHGWAVGREADGPDEVRKAVREQIRAGADVIKLMASGGVNTESTRPDHAQFTVEELAAAVDEAHKAGRKVAVHAHATPAIMNALVAGCDSIEHGVYLNQSAIQLMISKGVTLVPTLLAPSQILASSGARGLPQYAISKTQALFDAHLKSFKSAYEEGVAIAMGTDAGTPLNRHGSNLREIALMVGAGMKVMDAIIAVTGKAAQLLGIQDILGTLEVGKQADIVVFRNHPMEDVARLAEKKNIVQVYKSGQPVLPERDELVFQKEDAEALTMTSGTFAKIKTESWMHPAQGKV